MILIFSTRSRHFAVIELYGQMINLAFPIISIAVAAGLYYILLGATREAYMSLNSQLTTMGSSITAATERMLTR